MSVTACWTLNQKSGLYEVAMGFMDLPHDNFESFKQAFTEKVSEKMGKAVSISFCLNNTTMSSYQTTHQDASQLSLIFDQVKIEMKHPIKSANASRVLQLMDSCLDGEDRYQEFVKQVAVESNMSVEALEFELEPFI
ncbi:hypothetical protein [Vibrio alginolyticus]|uniref:hypothetical protein n=1 Tax=Vibrio alginolyticus TaxID=663 RepID=UPI0022AA0410|nr:hypothetical protein [Vibrio alginolyticus]MCZ2798998.1 hypothetical protein [Vibrio alginolyticus]